MNWNVGARGGRWISSGPIPKCLRRVQLLELQFDSRSLIQFTHFHNLEYLSISTRPEMTETERDKKVRFELLQYLSLQITNSNPAIEWLECPALVGLDLAYSLVPSENTYVYERLEACLLRFKSVRSLWVNLVFGADTSKSFDTSELQNMQPSMFDGSLELVQLTFSRETPPSRESAPAKALLKIFFSVFVQRTHLKWQYGQFPSPTIFANLKTVYISYEVEGNRSALVAQGMVEFPFLEELYIEGKAPKLLNLLHAPRLISLRLSGFMPLDLRHISNSIILIHLKLQNDEPG
jgi:hypothetical protein